MDNSDLDTGAQATAADARMRAQPRRTSAARMYDLTSDPLERVNLAYKHHKRTAEQQRQYRRLRRKLARVEQTRLKPLS